MIACQALLLPLPRTNLYKLSTKVTLHATHCDTSHVTSDMSHVTHITSCVHAVHDGVSSGHEQHAQPQQRIPTGRVHLNTKCGYNIMMEDGNRKHVHIWKIGHRVGIVWLADHKKCQRLRVSFCGLEGGPGQWKRRRCCERKHRGSEESGKHAGWRLRNIRKNCLRLECGTCCSGTSCCWRRRHCAPACSPTRSGS
jgi:hypothetical protein